MNQERLCGAWRAYPLRLAREQIDAKFIARYGYAPEMIVVAGPVQLAGPLRESDELRGGERVTVRTMGEGET